MRRLLRSCRKKSRIMLSSVSMRRSEPKSLNQRKNKLYEDVLGTE